ncbi:MAG: hypothetical protein RLZZ455_16 [Candidatus Parcubacteria bacterium]
MYNADVALNKEGSIILLTYKGKVLLFLEESTPIRSSSDVWSFIMGVKRKKETFEDAVVRAVFESMQIKLSEVTLLSNWVYDGEKKYFYHALLSDKDVNNIQRSEARTIDFFTLRELEKVKLEQITKLFIEKHRSLLEELCGN